MKNKYLCEIQAETAYLMSQRRATPRRTHLDGCCFDFKYKEEMKVKSVRCGFLYVGQS